MAEFVAWANVTETVKFYFTADSKEEADALCKKVAFGEMTLEELHKGDSNLKGIEVSVDEPEEV